ncbi:MAG: hypothetical protein NVS2B3_09270 [Vulcanimicrobiaceae bacterium]
MPLYEFACTTCGPFERRLSFDEAREAQTCPACARSSARVFSATYFRATPSASDLGRASDRDRMKRARSGEPRLERRPTDPAHVEPAWQPLHGAHGEK